MSRFAWSPVTVERLLTLRAQGHKLSSIAAELGTTSSAIEHKLRRLRSQKLAQAPAARGPLRPSSRNSDPLTRGVVPRERNDNPQKMMRSGLGAVANDVGIDCGAFSGGVKVSAQAARSMGGSVGFSARVGQPSTFLIVIWPEASSAQNSMAAVSAEGRTVWVLIRRLNSSCKRSTAFVVRADFH